MRRITGATAVADMFGTGKNGFKDGNKALGIIATIVLAEFMNGIQEEAMTLIEASGQTPNVADNTQILQALRAAGVFQTAAQFDNTTKAATTAFVQRALGNNQGVLVVTGNTTLTAADAGKLVVGGSATPFTVTLPLTSTIQDGGKFEFVNMNAGNMTIARQGTTDIINTSSTRTSEVLGTGDSLVLHAKPSLGMFYASSGTNQFAYAAKFGSLLSSSGYQKMPGGLILQYGVTSTVAQGGIQAITLPIAYPNSIRSVLATPANGAVAAGASANGLANSVSQITVVNTSVNNTPFAIYWATIGY